MAVIATPPPGPGKPFLSLQSRLILSHIRRNRFISVGTVVILTCLISAGFIEIYLNYFLPAHVVFETATSYSYSNTDVNLSPGNGNGNSNSNSNSRNQKNMNTQTDSDNLINLPVTDDHLITPPPPPQPPILSTTSTDTQTPLPVQQNSTATQTEAEEDEELLLLLTEQLEESPAADVANVLENNDNDTEVEIDVPDFVDLSSLNTVYAKINAPAAVEENLNVVEVEIMPEVQTLINLCGANETKTTFTLDHLPVENGKEEEITLQGLFINFTLDFHSISNDKRKELAKWFLALFSLAHMSHLFFIGPDRLASFIKRIRRFTDATTTTVDLIFLNDTIDYWNSYVFELRHLISFQTYLQVYYSFNGDPIISHPTFFKIVSFTDWSQPDRRIRDLAGAGEGGVRKVPLLSFNIIETESSSNELLLLNYLNRLKGVVKGFISELPADIQPVLVSDNIELKHPLFENSPLIHLIFYISLYNNLIQSTSLTVLKRFFSLG